MHEPGFMAPPPVQNNRMTVPASHSTTEICVPASSPGRFFRVLASAMLALMLAGGVFGLAQAVAQDTSSENSPSVDELIRQLGGRRFAARESAGEDLFELGPAVLPELMDAQSKLRFEDGNHECKMRLEQLIEALAKNDRDARIELFLHGGSADLKNWSEMRKWFGDQPRVREMFVDLYRNYPLMVESLRGSPQELSLAMESVKKKLRQNVNRNAFSTRVDVLALLIPMADPNFRRTGDEDFYVATMLNQHTADEFRKDRILGESFVRLVGNWMEGSSLRSRELVLRLALEWKMEIGIGLAKKTLLTNPTPTLLARCLQTISRQGTRDDMTLIAGYLDDQRRVFRRDYMAQYQNDVIVADVAAATIAYLASVPVTEIGFVDAAEHPTFGIIYEQLALPTPPQEPAEEPEPDENDVDDEKQPVNPAPPAAGGLNQAQLLLQARLRAQQLRIQQQRAQILQQRRRQALNDPEAQLKEFAEARATVRAAVDKLLPPTTKAAPQES